MESDWERLTRGGGITRDTHTHTHTRRSRLTQDCHGSHRLSWSRRDARRHDADTRHRVGLQQRTREIAAARGDSRAAFIYQGHRRPTLSSSLTIKSTLCHFKAEMNADRESPRAAAISPARP